MQTVLILDGQTNQALACARSLGRAGYRVLVASHFRWPLAAWSRYSSGQFYLRGETLEEYGRLRRRVADEGVDWVLPLTERACILCNLQRSEWEKEGGQIACADEATLDLAFDKWTTMRHARDCGVGVPETRLPTSLESVPDLGREIGFPCVVKPRFSNAWDGARFLPNRACAYVREPEELADQATDRRQGEDWPLLQSYVEGTGKGVFALCDRGRAVAWFAHERIRDVRPTGSGSSLRRSILLEPRLREPAERLLAELSWHGPAMVEFRDDGINPPWLMEVNGRFWTSLELAIQSGVDFPRLWLEILSDRPVQPVAPYRTNVTLRWIWGDMRRLLYLLAGRPRGYTGFFPTLSQGLREIFGPQPPGTRAEIYQRDDPWPAIAEWFQGARELMSVIRRPSAN
jgi:predicted ATP-grasp superfamily ATP-dependent carboligase